jgi:DNA-directed RNA polymerase subunit K/omega
MSFNNSTIIFDKLYNTTEQIEFKPVLSQNFISKYEKTSIISMRLQQLANNSPTLLNNDELKDCKNIYDIVDKEYKLKKIPFKISRPLPNNKKEIVSLNYLEDYNI